MGIRDVRRRCPDKKRKKKCIVSGLMRIIPEATQQVMIDGETTAESWKR